MSDSLPRKISAIKLNLNISGELDKKSNINGASKSVPFGFGTPNGLPKYPSPKTFFEDSKFQITTLFSTNSPLNVFFDML